MCAGRVAELPGECCAAGVVTPAAGVVMRHCRPVGKATFSMLISAATQSCPGGVGWSPLRPPNTQVGWSTTAVLVASITDFAGPSLTLGGPM